MREKKQSEKNQRDAQTRNQEEKKQEKNFQKNHIPKITVLLFVVAVLLVILIGKQSWNEYRDSIIDNQKKQLLLTVQGLCDSMEEFMASYVDDLEGLCILSEKNWDQKEERNGVQNKEVADWSCLEEYVDTHELPM